MIYINKNNYCYEKTQICCNKIFFRLNKYRTKLDVNQLLRILLLKVVAR